MKYTYYLSALFITFSFCSFAQQEKTGGDSSFYDMSLEQLMNVHVTVASQLPGTSREAPGIISVITHEEIKRSNAIDLVQLLQQLPGFDFGVDVDGVIGIGVRGNWANEGKVLLVCDGMEYNEELYGTLQFIHHYPIDRIRKIEIIRGPGSAKYGGNAEYAVINLITFNDSSYIGTNANVQYSQMSKTYSSRSVSLANGLRAGDVHINLSGVLGEATKSQREYHDYLGNSFDMTNQSHIANTIGRMDVFVKNFSMTGFYNSYIMEQRDGYDVIYNRAYNVAFNTAFLTARYDIHGKNNLLITPGIKIKYQQPWRYKQQVVNDIFSPFNTTINKKQYFINSSLEPSKRVSLEAGVSYYNQRAKDLLDSSYFSSGSKEFVIDNYEGFVQSTIKTPMFNIIFGSRYAFNPYYKSSFVPRAGLTRVFNKFHFKALYSKAYREPSVENINLGNGIKPERTTVIEFEAGTGITQSSYLTANVYRIITENPIVYGYDSDLNDFYINDSNTGTIGLEAEYKLKQKGYFLTANYSLYCLPKSSESRNSLYYIPGIINQHLAFARNKYNFNANVSFSKKINMTLSQVIISKRYSYLIDDFGIVSVFKHNPSFYSNAAFNFENVFTEGLHVQLSCTNIFDEKVIFIQPYKGNHMPLPGKSREFQVKLFYTLR